MDFNETLLMYSPRCYVEMAKKFSSKIVPLLRYHYPTTLCFVMKLCEYILTYKRVLNSITVVSNLKVEFNLKTIISSFQIEL